MCFNFAEHLPDVNASVSALLDTFLVLAFRTSGAKAFCVLDGVCKRRAARDPTHLLDQLRQDPVVAEQGFESPRISYLHTM